MSPSIHPSYRPSLVKLTMLLSAQKCVKRGNQVSLTALKTGIEWLKKFERNRGKNHSATKIIHDWLYLRESRKQTDTIQYRNDIGS